MYLLIHTHGHIEVSHYAFRSFENTAEGIGMVLWNLQSEDLASQRRWCSWTALSLFRYTN
jgi:hypothetical protein